MEKAYEAMAGLNVDPKLLIEVSTASMRLLREARYLRAEVDRRPNIPPEKA
jgi:hypothetical protein